ncbi:hypothetical protein [Pseudomonas sp. LP_7_YM]|uniref:hypothetical protein n=1 Tax=Pseudomonas sp. LP_7_YM TaxID=2485137 RepID=UPI0021154CB9|nr:hypothetical protein [Pseudomonas sp. LP_7_YM]
MYDRISEKRLAAEARAREEAEQAAAVAAIAMKNEPAHGFPLQPSRNELKIAGLALLMPQLLAFRDLDMTFEREGQLVTFSAKRRPAPEGLTLQRSTELYVDNLRKHHGDVTVVRQNDCLLAGSPAVSLDYAFKLGQERRHGRAISAIVAPADGNERQWFSVSTVINPDHPALSNWLIDFDEMLGSIAAC